MEKEVHVKIDADSYNKGFQEGLEFGEFSSIEEPPGVDGYSYYSGLVEGKAKRLQNANQKNLSLPNE